MESTCRNCGRKGHWRAECPDRARSAGSTGSASTSAAMTAEAVSFDGEPDALPMEFVQLPVVHETSIDVPSLHEINTVSSVPHEIWERIRNRGNNNNLGVKNMISSRCQSRPRSELPVAKPVMMQPFCEASDTEVAFFSAHGTYGILDTGATKSVVGSSHLPALIGSFPADVQKQLRRTTCEITFRFGNQGTLNSQHALVIPLNAIGMGLKVAIVPGATPLLLSNTLVRTLKASIDSARQVLTSPMFAQPVPLKLSPRGLYLLDINDLIQAQKGQHSGQDRPAAETFHSSDFPECQNASSHDQKSVMSSQHVADVMPHIPHSHVDTPTSTIKLKAPTHAHDSQEIHKTCRNAQSRIEDITVKSSRPKPLPTEFLQVVRSTHNLCNEPHQPFGPCAVPGKSRKCGVIPHVDGCRDGRIQDQLRPNTHRPDIRRDVEIGKGVDQMVCQDICLQPEGRTPETPDLHRDHGESARDPLRHDPNDSSGDQSRGTSPTSQRAAQEQSSSRPVTGDASAQRDLRGGGAMGSMGCHVSRRQPTARDHRCTAEPSPQCGERAHRDSESCAADSPSSPLDHLLNAGDWEYDFDPDHNHQHNMNSTQSKFNNLVSQFTAELNEVSTWDSLRHQPRLQVLEVFCSPESELTRQVNQLGYRASRHGIQEGDLNSKGGRQQLFKTLLESRPQHVWFSPACGPWCAWSFLNESQSAAGFQHVQEQRDQHLYQLAIGLVLYRFQCIHQRHLHWEQPARSLMLKTPYLYEVAQGTYRANFDMCQVGGMRDPQNQKLFKKSMEIHTTSQQLYFQFNGRKCNKQHDHQPLEGNTIHKGVSIRRTAFSENYTRKFARSLAQVLTKVKNMKEMPIMCLESTAFAMQGIKRLSKAQTGVSAKRAKLQNSSLIEPQEMPAKRRRIQGKSQEFESSSALCDRICTNVTAIAPRVGRKTIQDPKILQDIQELFPEKLVITVLVCKGTERTVQPPKDMIPSEAPYRRAIIMQRQTKKILVEDQWEHWEFLSARQQWRRSHPSYMNITVFARNHPTAEEPVTVPSLPARTEIREPAPASQSHETPDEPPHAPMMPMPSPDTSEENTTPMSIDESSQDHGPKFLEMSPENKKLALRLHKNLGHPDPRRLSQVLQQRGYDSSIVQGVLDLKCSICQMQKMPKIPRPASLKQELGFGDKVSMDGVKWTNRQGQEFHFYHFIDHGTNYHTAIIAPNRAEIREKFTMGWLNWAGPPNTVLMDSASEFISEGFVQFLQNLSIQCEVVPPDAHWQCGRVERHGGVLQNMLSKFELEHDVSNYQQFQQALTQCTMAKNSCSLRHGYAPDTLVFGRGLKIPASITSDDSLPAHAIAESETNAGLRFRELLAMRETARRAFHAADNDMALRRAALRRDRPHRGAYESGEWVMVWKINNHKGSWICPARVIKQDNSTTVFCNNAGSIVKAAPEHVRPVSAVEARLIPINMPDMPNLENSQSHSPLPIESHQEVPSAINNQDNRSNQGPITIPNNPQTVTSSESTSDQPDQEPEELPITPVNPENQDSTHNVPDSNPETSNVQPHEVPVPDESSDELMCDLLTCEDINAMTATAPDGENTVWRAEMDFNASLVETVCHSANNPTEEELVFLATNSKRQRTEVKLNTLEPEERLEFEKAKSKEVNNWLQTGTVERMFRHELAPEQILRCRWLYVWKPVEDPKEQKELGGKSRKAKARLVVLGYMDPQLDTIPRDSPTLGRTSKMFIAQVIASMQWSLMSFDIKAAFLQGKTQEGRVIAIEPVPEMVKAMSLEKTEVCRLVKSAYGLIDAPFLWFTELDKTLKELGFISSPFDPCLYLLHEKDKKEPAGILGIHVDDGLCGGNEFFHQQIRKLEQKFPFGSRKSQKFVFTGIEMTQENDYSITMSQENYISRINPIHIQPTRKANVDLAVTERERQDLRALIGSLQYASVNTRPDLASRLSFLQSAINNATIDTLIHGNKVLHEAKRHKTTCVRIQPIPMDKVRFLAFSDASFASKKQPESHTGTIIMTTHEDIGKNHVCPVNPISWECKKIQRVVTSTLAAETTSLSSTLDQLSWLRLFWSWIKDPLTNWRKPTETLKALPPTYATATFKEDPSIAVTDCKSLFDLVTRTATPSCSEFRTQLQAHAIKDFLAEGVRLRWVHSGAQLADALTKIMECHFLRQTLFHGKYCLHDESQILKERASTKTRVKWLQSTDQNDITKSEN